MHTAFATARGASAPRPLGWGDERRGVQAGRRAGVPDRLAPHAHPAACGPSRQAPRDSLAQPATLTRCSAGTCDTGFRQAGGAS